MIIGVPKETLPGERRVAIIPEVVPALIKLGLKVTIESDAGVPAGFGNDAYTSKGAEIVSSREVLIKAADIIAQVRTLGSNQIVGKNDLEFGCLSLANHSAPGMRVYSVLQAAMLYTVPEKKDPFRSEDHHRT